jgi:hypothetical protein
MAPSSITRLSVFLTLLFAFAITVNAQTQTICGTIEPEFATNGSHWKGPVHLVLNPTGMPAGVKLEDEQLAIQAWERYAEVEIALSVDFSAAGGNTHDGSSVISFGGPSPGPSVVAQTFNSVNGDEITESDIVFFEGKDEILNQPGQFASIFCHELGHALGLGHSFDPVAMMYNVAHGAERGATLSLDDRAAIQFVYQPKPATGPAVSSAKLKTDKLIVSGEVGDAVTIWVNGETFQVKLKADNLIAIIDCPMVAKGFNVFVIYTSTSSSDPFFF